MTHTEYKNVYVASQQAKFNFLVLLETPKYTIKYIQQQGWILHGMSP